MDDAQIKTDFNELYLCVKGMVLREMDQIMYPALTPRRHHEKSGFVEGVMIIIRLEKELK